MPIPMRFFLSIRFKLLLVFTVVFTIAFAIFGVLFYRRFSDYAVELATAKLQSDANYLSQGIAAGITPQEYYAIADQQDTQLRDELVAYFVDEWIAAEPDLEIEISVLKVEADQIKNVLYIADGEVRQEEDPPYQNPIETDIDRAEWAKIAEFPYYYDINEDNGILWTTSSQPILDPDQDYEPTGGVIFIDIRTDDQIATVRRDVRDTLLLAAAIAYPLLFLVTFLVALTASRTLSPLMRASQALETDEPYNKRWLEKATRRVDELGQLARVFDKMAVEVQERHQRLKQEVARLKVEIDHAKKEKQVAEITESDYFKEMKEKVAELRKRTAESVPTQKKDE